MPSFKDSSLVRDRTRTENAPNWIHSESGRQAARGAPGLEIWEQVMGSGEVPRGTRQRLVKGD